MKTLADFKRRLAPGTAVTVEFPGAVIRGNLGDTALPSRTATRKVHSASASMVIWESETTSGAKGSRLDFNGADRFAFPDANTCTVAHEPGGKPFATYRF